MFQSYFELGSRIRKHYFSPRVMLCLASGQFVPPIHRGNLYSLQYSMLPAERVSITELWDQLNGTAEALQVSRDSPESSIRLNALGSNAPKSF
jgi:phosphatidylinositol N-acetylglucosaminyltransferase subunit Q